MLAVINISLGPGDAEAKFDELDPINTATKVVASLAPCVVAAGNDSQRADRRDTMSAWAEAPWVIAVGATADPLGRQLADYSSVGEPSRPSGPHVVAYGVSDVDPHPIGTSFAAPRVSGALAVFASMLLTLRHENERLGKGKNRNGIPVVCVGLVDEGLAEFRREAAPRALPSVGVDRKNLRAVRQRLKQYGSELDIWPTANALRGLLFHVATPLPQYHDFEVGAGFIGPQEVRRVVRQIDGEILAALFAEPRPADSELESLRGVTLFDPSLVDIAVQIWETNLIRVTVDIGSGEFVDFNGDRIDLELILTGRRGK
jgi:hypothetical protein